MSGYVRDDAGAGSARGWSSRDAAAAQHLRFDRLTRRHVLHLLRHAVRVPLRQVLQGFPWSATCPIPELREYIRSSAAVVPMTTATAALSPPPGTVMRVRRRRA